MTSGPPHEQPALAAHASQALMLDRNGLPALFRSADESSLGGQRLFLRATQLRLTMLIIAAGAGALAVEEGFEWAGFVAAATFVVALTAEIFIMTSRPERVWFEGRSAAESVKTLAWRYSVGGEPFPLQGADARDSDRLFLERLRDILHDLRNVDLAPSLGGGEQITDEMRALRASDLEQRKHVYNIARLEDQRLWYAKGSARNEARARWWMIGMIAAEVAGATFGLLRAAGAFHLDLLGFAATIAATIAAWMQAKQHQMQTRAYFLAAEELAAIRSEIGLHDTEPEWATFVDQAEEAISREHVLWRASRGA